MTVGYVLVSVEPGKERDVDTAIMKIKKVKEHYALSGEYDFILKVEADSFNDLGAVVTGEIRKIGGVRDTQTLTGINFLNH